METKFGRIYIPSDVPLLVFVKILLAIKCGFPSAALTLKPGAQRSGIPASGVCMVPSHLFPNADTDPMVMSCGM